MSRKLLMLPLLIILVGNLAYAKDRYKLKDNVYIVEGDDLPKYVYVDVFFANASERYRLGNPHYHYFLQEIQISPGSDAEKAVVEAVLNWRKAKTDSIDMAPFVNVDKAIWDDIQRDNLRKEAGFVGLLIMESSWKEFYLKGPLFDSWRGFVASCLTLEWLLTPELHTALKDGSC